jgi:hypothetical protein
MQCQEKISCWFSQQFVEITARSSITWKASEPMTTNKSIEIGWLVLQLTFAQWLETSCWFGTMELGGPTYRLVKCYTQSA